MAPALPKQPEKTQHQGKGRVSNTPAKWTVYEIATGRAVECWPVDARELVATGDYAWNAPDASGTATGGPPKEESTQPPADPRIAEILGGNAKAAIGAVEKLDATANATLLEQLLAAERAGAKRKTVEAAILAKAIGDEPPADAGEGETPSGAGDQTPPADTGA